jgi:hypothetical protein
VADDTGYQPSPLGGAPVASTTALPILPPPKSTGAYSPSDIKGAIINAGVPPSAATTLTAITGAESGFGKHVVSGVNKDGSRDYGVGQINSHAWPQFGGPAVASLPLQQQANIIAHVYNHQGLTAWSTYNNGAYKKYLGQVDSTDPTGAPLPAGAAPPPPPPAQQAGIGAAIAALNAPTGGPGTKSTADNLSSMAGGGGGGGGSAPPPLDLQAQQAAAAQGNARQMMLAQQGAQLAAALRGAGGARGSPGPASTMAYMGGQTIPMPVASPTPGAPQPPGTTLNSTGGLYG